MVQESFACPACHESVPPGRLSCPHCGTVLASVAGRRLPEPARSIIARGAPPDEPIESIESRGSESTAPIEVPAAAPSARAASPGSSSPLTPTVEGTQSVLGSVGETEPRWAAVPEPWEATEPAAATESAATEPPWAAVTTPGSWVPPAARSSVVSGRDAGPPAPFRAREWMGQHASAEHGEAMSASNLPAPAPPGPPIAAFHASAAPAIGAQAGATAVAVPSAAGAVPSTSSERRPFLAIDGARIDDAAGWLVLAGAMATAIGFIVPWSRVVIGARGAGGYTDTWGLAGPGHAVVLIAALVIFTLAAVRNPVGPWLRTGVAGLVLGSLVLGLVWPYVFGPLGAGPGVMLLVVAAAILIVGGLASAVVHRHATVPPPV